MMTTVRYCCYSSLLGFEKVRRTRGSMIIEGYHYVDRMRPMSIAALQEAHKFTHIN